MCIRDSCKAIGWVVPEYDRAQISINLTDFTVTPPHVVLEAARRLAAERGLVVTGSELVGLIPFEALADAGRYYLQAQGRTPGVPTSDLLATAVQSMGLSDVSPFDVATKVLGAPKTDAGPLVNLTAVSYTHLDVYKRQVQQRLLASGVRSWPGSLGLSRSSSSSCDVVDAGPSAALVVRRPGADFRVSRSSCTHVSTALRPKRENC